MEPKQSKENALFEWYDSLVFALDRTLANRVMI